MPFLIAIGLGIVLGLGRGGRLRGLAALRLRSPWLLAAGVVFWLALSGPAIRSWPGLGPWGGALQIITQLLLLAFVWQNRMVRWLPLAGLGLLANFAVMGANGGQMPVDPPLLRELGIEAAVQGAQAQGLWLHFNPLGEAARLGFLGDWLLLPKPFPWPGIMSPGDVIIALGALLVVQSAMVRGESTRTAVRIMLQ